ncbi:MAG: hypothetical protein RIB46_09755 [Pseudomonadales bacterium]
MIARSLTLSFACLCAIAQADPGGAHMVVGWPGGAAAVVSYDFDDPVGEVSAEGAIHFELPVPPASRQTVADTFDRCPTGKLDIENGAAPVTPVMLLVELGGRELSLAAASSPDMAAWTLSFGQAPLVKGSFLRWLHVDGAASVSGECVETLLTDAGDLETRTEWRLELAPGWNLIRTTYLDYAELEDGRRQETHTVHDAVVALPEDARWYLEQD